jgi:hypothetical protein
VALAGWRIKLSERKMAVVCCSGTCGPRQASGEDVLNWKNAACILSDVFPASGKHGLTRAVNEPYDPHLLRGFLRPCQTQNIFAAVPETSGSAQGCDCHGSVLTVCIETSCLSFRLRMPNRAGLGVRWERGAGRGMSPDMMKARV